MPGNKSTIYNRSVEFLGKNRVWGRGKLSRKFLFIKFYLVSAKFYHILPSFTSVLSFTN